MAVPTTGLLFMKMEVFDSDGVWEKPSTVEWIRVIAVGAGAGGGGNEVGGSHVGGGGGGGEIKDRILPVTDDVIVTLGEGGLGGAGDADGNDGGDTTLTGGCTLTAKGGIKGLKGTVHDDGNGGNGGGYPWWMYVAGETPRGSTGMASFCPGYGNPGASAPNGGGPGGGSYEDGGDAVGCANGGSAAANSGGGGAGAGNGPDAHSGGDGGKGKVIIFWYE
jgi:hypothetical protein